MGSSIGRRLPVAEQRFTPSPSAILYSPWPGLGGADAGTSARISTGICRVVLSTTDASGKRKVPSQLFVDSSAFYALIDRDDANHRRAFSLFRIAARRRRQLVTTNLVVAEAHALILSRLGRVLAARWLLSLTAGVIRVTEEDESRAKSIIVTYHDKDFSYCDAASFAVMERLSLSQALAFGVHFRQHARFEILR